MPAGFLVFSVAKPFLYSSAVKGNTSEESFSLIENDVGHMCFVGISPRPLTSSWYATWLAVTIQGGFEAVGSLEIFLIVVVSTHSIDPCLWGKFDHPAFGAPASLSLHLASSSITPAVISINPGVTVWCVCGCS